MNRHGSPPRSGCSPYRCTVEPSVTCEEAGWLLLLGRRDIRGCYFRGSSSVGLEQLWSIWNDPLKERSEFSSRDVRRPVYGGIFPVSREG